MLIFHNFYMFRELPALAKQLIVRLLYIEQAIPQAVVSSWVSHQFQSQSRKTHETLTSLRVSIFLLELENRRTNPCQAYMIIVCRLNQI